MFLNFVGFPLNKINFNFSNFTFMFLLDGTVLPFIPLARFLQIFWKFNDFYETKICQHMYPSNLKLFSFSSIIILLTTPKVDWILHENNHRIIFSDQKLELIPYVAKSWSKTKGPFVLGTQFCQSKSKINKRKSTPIVFEPQIQ